MLFFLLRNNHSGNRRVCLTAEPLDLPAVSSEAELSGSAQMSLSNTPSDPPRDQTIPNTPVDPTRDQSTNTPVDPPNVQPPIRQRLGEDLFRLVQVRRN